MHGVAVLRSVLCVCPSVPFRPRLFLILHVLFGPVCFVSVRTFLVLAVVPVRLPSLYSGKGARAGNPLVIFTFS